MHYHVQPCQAATYCPASFYPLRILFLPNLEQRSPVTDTLVLWQAMRKSELTDPSATPAQDDGGTSPKQLIQTVVGKADGCCVRVWLSDAVCQDVCGPSSAVRLLQSCVDSWCPYFCVKLLCRKKETKCISLQLCFCNTNDFLSTKYMMFVSEEEENVVPFIVALKNTKKGESGKILFCCSDSS